MLQNLDVEYLYEAPLAMEKERLAQVVCECLNIPCPEPQLGDWKQMVDALKNPTSEVTIALVGKYIQLHDAYLSVMEALKHGGIANRTKVSIKWVDSEFLTPEILDDTFAGADGIIIPGGFGSRGTRGNDPGSQLCEREQDPIPRNLPRHADGHGRICEKCSGI